MKHPLGRRRKLRPFESLSRKKRGNAVVRLRQRILQDKDIYGGMFTSHLVLGEPGRPPLYNQWTGLHIAVNAAEITQSVIEQAILRFKELGEVG